MRGAGAGNGNGTRIGERKGDRGRGKRRVSKEQLALAVRKDFNAAAVNELEVWSELVFVVRNGRGG